MESQDTTTANKTGPDFQGITNLNHPTISRTYDALSAYLIAHSGLSLALIYGPTGVGKTTLINRIEKKIKEQYSVEMASNPGFIPLCKIEAPAPDNGKFNWRDFYERTLRVLNEPCVDNKSLPKTPETLHRSQTPQTTRTSRSQSSAALRLALENCLRHRGTKVLIVDEAQHLNKVTNSRQWMESMDVIKSLANVSNVFIVLVGTYDLLQLSHLSGQLARRTVDIHFPRYLKDSPRDINEFNNVIYTFEKGMPFKESSKLISHSEYLYEGCHGCVGLLKLWLNRAVCKAVSTGKNTLEYASLRETILAPSALRTILKEIKEGESKLPDVETSFDPDKKLGTIAKHGAADVPSDSGKPKMPSPRSFQRNPIRDAVGIK